MGGTIGRRISAIRAVHVFSKIDHDSTLGFALKIFRRISQYLELGLYHERKFMVSDSRTSLGFLRVG